MTRRWHTQAACGLLGWAACTLAWAGTLQVTVTDDKGKALADAVVFLDSPAAKAAFKPLVGVEVEQVDKQFAPRVAVVTAGSQVSFPNRDKVRHHVYSFSPAKTFDLKLYTGTPANPVLFDKPGVVVLGCNIHDLMASWILVLETPYFGKTAASGQVALPDVAPGTYQMKVWHPGLPVGNPAQERAITVGAANATATFSLKGVAQ
ncbi:MAG: methylamine utilization protein [Rhodoferax sp.]|jgi:plastocyanin|nr:methylamine utilization protein [Rhodoferax sp.]